MALAFGSQKSAPPSADNLSLTCGQKCTVAIKFDPQKQGTGLGAITINDNTLLGIEILARSGTDN